MSKNKKWSYNIYIYTIVTIQRHIKICIHNVYIYIYIYIYIHTYIYIYICQNKNQTCMNRCNKYILPYSPYCLWKSPEITQLSPSCPGRAARGGAAAVVRLKQWTPAPWRQITACVQVGSKVENPEFLFIESKWWTRILSNSEEFW